MAELDTSTGEIKGGRGLTAREVCDRMKQVYTWKQEKKDLAAKEKLLCNAIGKWLTAEGLSDFTDPETGLIAIWAHSVRYHYDVKDMPDALVLMLKGHEALEVNNGLVEKHARADQAGWAREALGRRRPEESPYVDIRRLK